MCTIHPKGRGPVLLWGWEGGIRVTEQKKDWPNSESQSRRGPGKLSKALGPQAILQFSLSPVDGVGFHRDGSYDSG